MGKEFIEKYFRGVMRIKYRVCFLRFGEEKRWERGKVRGGEGCAGRLESGFGLGTECLGKILVKVIFGEF